MDPDEVNSYASSDEARRRWREMLDAVEHRGEHVIVQRYTRPVAAVVPVKWYEQAQQALANGEEKP
jgi:prevent-host-death family protein